MGTRTNLHCSLLHIEFMMERHGSATHNVKDARVD
jgi:hypothetical protein